MSELLIGRNQSLPPLKSNPSIAPQTDPQWCCLYTRVVAIVAWDDLRGLVLLWPLFCNSRSASPPRFASCSCHHFGGWPSCSQACSIPACVSELMANRPTRADRNCSIGRPYEQLSVDMTELLPFRDSPDLYQATHMHVLAWVLYSSSVYSSQSEEED